MTAARLPTAPDLAAAARPRRRPAAGAALAAALLLAAGCAPAADRAGEAQPAAPSPSAGQPAAAPAEPGGPGVGVSPGGVTTRIDEPAQSTEEQYGQSCVAAKEWLAAQGGDPRDHVEALLREAQAGAEASPITFRTTWADLSTAQRAAVIVAVRAAADGGC